MTENKMTENKMTENTLPDFVPEVEYEVTIVRKKTRVESNATSYKKVGTFQEDGEYNKAGETKYGYVLKPPHVVTDKEAVFKQTSDKVDILSLIAAVNGVTFP